jgi:hypothetical protein
MPVTESRKARRLAPGVAALALASALALAPVTASAVPPVFTPEQDFESDYTAGTACPFELLVQGSGSEKTVKGFTDQSNNSRLLAPGKGWNLTFSRLNDAGTPVKSVTFPSTGSVTDLKLFPGPPPPDGGEDLNGSRTLHAAGTFFLVLFPYDVPGPSATLYTGGEVYLTSRDDEGAIWRLQRDSGRTTDICALLA